MALFQGRPKARGRVVTQSNFIYTPAYRYEVVNIIFLLLFCMSVVSTWQDFMLHVSIAYLLHVASCYNPMEIGRCVGNRNGPVDST